MSASPLALPLKYRRKSLSTSPGPLSRSPSPSSMPSQSPSSSKPSYYAYSSCARTENWMHSDDDLEPPLTSDDALTAPSSGSRAASLAPDEDAFVDIVSSSPVRDAHFYSYTQRALKMPRYSGPAPEARYESKHLPTYSDDAHDVAAALLALHAHPRLASPKLFSRISSHPPAPHISSSIFPTRSPHRPVQLTAPPNRNPSETCRALIDKELRDTVVDGGNVEGGFDDGSSDGSSDVEVDQQPRRRAVRYEHERRYSPLPPSSPPSEAEELPHEVEESSPDDHAPYEGVRLEATGTVAHPLDALVSERIQPLFHENNPLDASSSNNFHNLSSPLSSPPSSPMSSVRLLPNVSRPSHPPSAHLKRKATPVHGESTLKKARLDSERLETLSSAHDACLRIDKVSKSMETAIEDNNTKKISRASLVPIAKPTEGKRKEVEDAVEVRQRSMKVDPKPKKPRLGRSDGSSKSPIALDQLPLSERREASHGSKDRPNKSILRDTHDAKHRPRSHRAVVPKSADTRKALPPSPAKVSDRAKEDTQNNDDAPHGELLGLLIETLAFSRASSLPATAIWREVRAAHPAAFAKGPEDVSASEDEGGRKIISDDEDNEGMGPVEELLEWGIRRGVFGRIESSGESLPPSFFYIPSGDPDPERAALLESLAPRPAKRAETMKYKQYYWRPVTVTRERDGRRTRSARHEDTPQNKRVWDVDWEE